MATYYSHGKLLLTAEYLVLDGAQALAMPTKYGQSLEVTKNPQQEIVWKSIDCYGVVWFTTTISLDLDKSSNTNNIAQRLLEILRAIKEVKPMLFKQGITFKSTLEFPQNWGLGSSSTLINNLASWAAIDPYTLLEKTFGGSGYDIACAQHSSAVTYQLQHHDRLVEQIAFSPPFKEHLYFVHLNKKQNSREGIAAYRANKGDLDVAIKTVNSITAAMISCREIDEFNTLIEQHEQLISGIIGIDTVKNRLFNDFNGTIKSLGAWGGDFILISDSSNSTGYFLNKGFTTIVPYSDMIL